MRKKIEKAWTLGVVHTANVLCDFGPSLFGYKGFIIYTLQQDKCECKKFGHVSVNDLHSH